MREIKFRAWDDRQMRFPNMIDIRSAPHSFTCYTTDGKDPAWFDANRVMQFTGLKDKNGKEIYEGDVLNFVFDDVIFIKNPYYVVFEGGAFVINKPNFHPLVYDCNTVEIIGNIYENPELLKEHGHEAKEFEL